MTDRGFNPKGNAPMRWQRAFSLFFLGGLMLAGVFWAGFAVGEHRSREANTAPAEYATFWRVRDILQQTFVGERPAAQAQMFGAAHGLVSSYSDPHTVFVEPVARTIERDTLRGHFGGIGAYLVRNEAGDLVLTVMRDRPAARAGAKDGDVLLAVNGQTIAADMPVQDIIALIRGEVGSQVVLTLRRPGQDDPLSITVVRERIETPSVEWRVLDAEHGIGYIRISSFSERTGEELRAAITELATQGISQLALDIRGNTGGLVDAAVETTSQFLAAGTVLVEIRRDGQERFYPVERTKSPAQQWPLVVLVDAGTASAAEIVAGALRDQGRGILIGEKTYGKGSVQEIHEFDDGSSLHVTVARWLTPNRNQLDKVGLTPDITIGITEADRAAGRDPQLARGQAWLLGQH